jgi:hypothetical protein
VMPCLVLAWDRQVPVPPGWLLSVGVQVMPCLVLPWVRLVPVHLRLASTRGRSGDALHSVTMGQAGPCPFQACLCIVQCCYVTGLSLFISGWLLPVGGKGLTENTMTPLDSDKISRLDRKWF